MRRTTDEKLRWSRTSGTDYNSLEDSYGQWEYFCGDCSSWLPLDFNCWNPRAGMNRCLACHREYRAAKKRERRLDPVLRAIDVAAVRDIRSTKGHIYVERVREKRHNARTNA